MSFEIISNTYPPAHEIQVVQPQYSAQHLGDTISIGENQNLSINLIQDYINPIYQLEFNSEILSELNVLNPDIKSLKLNQIEQKSGQIDSVSTDIKIGAVESELELNAEDIQNEMTLLSESGLSFKIKKELQINNLKPKIQPVISFKKSLKQFQNKSKTKKSPKRQFSLQQAMKFGVPKKIKLNSPYLESVKIDQSLRINQNREIADFSDDMEDLTKSLNSLLTSNFGTNSMTFSLEGDLEEISAKLQFPVSAIGSDELELEIETNLPEVMIDGENLRDEMESKLSLKYGININNSTKLEMESSYNLNTRDYKIILMTLIE